MSAETTASSPVNASTSSLVEERSKRRTVTLAGNSAVDSGLATTLTWKPDATRAATIGVPALPDP